MKSSLVYVKLRDSSLDGECNTVHISLKYIIHYLIGNLVIKKNMVIDHIRNERKSTFSIHVNPKKLKMHYQ